MNILQNIIVKTVLGFMVFATPALQAAELAQWLGRASHIAVLTIMDGKKLIPPEQLDEACHFEYGVRVAKLVRGEEIRSIVTDAQLAIGGRYLLVVAENVPWIGRRFADDIPPRPSEFNEPEVCSKAFPDSLLVRENEIRPIETQDHSRQDWVSFPPRLFHAPKQMVKVSDLERLEFIKDRIEWPGIPLHDHFLLAEVLSLVTTKSRKDE